METFVCIRHCHSDAVWQKVSVCGCCCSCYGYSEAVCVCVALIFAFVGFAQMTQWALGKHKNYRAEFKDYPRGRKAIIPFMI